MKSMQAKLLTIIGFLLTACMAMAQAPVPQPPDPPPPITFDDMKPFITWPGSDEFVVSFPSVVTTPYPENNVVPIHILLPHDKTGPFPVVVILHYWGAMNRNVERAMGQELNKRGIAAVLMTLPYHLDRTPPGSRSGELAIQSDPDALNGTLLQSLQDTRRAIDFIESRPEFDHDKIGIGGLSLGAIVTALVYGVDNRLKHAVFVLGGVDLAHILWYSSRVVPQREAMRQKGFTEEKLCEALANFEPGTFLAARPDTEALVIAARYDTVIPEKSTQELIADIKNPKVSWMDTGHFGGVFVQKRLLKETCDYFENSFADKAFVPLSNLGAPTIRLGVEYSFSSGMDIGFGADLLSMGKQREYAATILATPRGLRLFLGRRAGHQLSVGTFIDRNHLTAGVLWSTVL
jgi:dienelactone hydrolase